MNENGNEPTPTPQSGEPPSTTGEAPIPEPAAPAVEPTPAPEFRYAPGSGVPTWLEGKTAAEAADIAANLYNTTLSQGAQPAQPAPAPQPTGYAPQPQYVQPQQPPTVTGQPMPSQDDWLTQPEVATRQTFDAMSQPFSQQIQNQQSMLAEIAKQQAQSRHADTFAKYGPEVVAMMGQLSSDQVTPQNLDMIVSVVKGNHAGEIEEAEINRRIQERLDSGTLRPSGDATAPSLSPANGLDLSNEAFNNPVAIGSADVPLNEVFNKAGVTASVADEFLAKAYPGLSLTEARKKYTQAASGGNAFSENNV